jgi:hypothetical protein
MLPVTGTTFVDLADLVSTLSFSSGRVGGRCAGLVRRRAGENRVVRGVGEEDLRRVVRRDVAACVVGADADVDVDRAPRVPARPDRPEAHLAVHGTRPEPGIDAGYLVAAQEVLALRARYALVGVEPVRIRVPDVDMGAVDGVVAVVRVADVDP